jgi:hypothetical protein
MTTNRSSALDALALGVNCPNCGSHTDEACQTRRTGKATLPHTRRIDRAVRLFQKKEH